MSETKLGNENGVKSLWLLSVSVIGFRDVKIQKWSLDNRSFVTMVKLAVQLMLHVISKRSVMACRLLKRVYHLCLVCLWCLCAPCYCLSLRNSCCCSIPFALRWLTVVRYILRKYYQQVQWLSFQSVWFLYFAAASDRVERWGSAAHCTAVKLTLCCLKVQFAVS